MPSVRRTESNPKEPIKNFMFQAPEPGGPRVAESAGASSTPLILCNVIIVPLFIHVFVYSLRYTRLKQRC
jgi:hypothetical protein